MKHLNYSSTQSHLPLWGIQSFLFLLFTFYFLLLMSCEKQTTNPPPSPEPEIDLSLAEEPHLTEISLKLETRNLALPQQFLITRNDSAIFNGVIAANDTTVTDTGLFPATTYSYRAYRMANGQRADSSAVLQASTMDTTSHNFTWEVLAFGDGSSSVLRDVAIVNENYIWVVGEIYLRDSTGQEIRYNAAHWDGQQWELKRIPFTGWCSAVEFPPIRSIFAFSENDIWFARGGSLVYFNGNSFYNDCGVNALLDGSINKIWGTDSNNMFIVGGSGTIAHYNGSSWQKLESRTDVNLLDVWGSPDTEGTSGSTVWACGTEVGKPTVLLQYQNGLLETVYEDTDYLFQVREDTLSGRLVSGRAFDGRYCYVLSSLGLYRLPLSGNHAIRRLSFTPNLFPGFPRRVHGNGPNDLAIAGDLYMIAHYNGSTWKHYDEHLAPGRFFSVYQRENLLVAAGHSADLLSKGVILVGRR